MPNTTPGISSGTPAEHRLREQLATCADVCAHRRHDADSCPLCTVRKLAPAEILWWLDGLSDEARDYLMFYHQCGIVIRHENPRSAAAPVAAHSPEGVNTALPANIPATSVPAARLRSIDPPEETLMTAYCRKYHCTPADYTRSLFLRACYPPARWLALGGRYRADSFTLDRALVAYCGILRNLRELDCELDAYAANRENQKFLRRVLRLRVSGRRLRKVAAECFEQ